MSASAYGITLAIAAVGGAIAVYLQRRFPSRMFAAGMVNVTFSVLVVVAFRLMTGRAAPYFWTAEGAGAEPWERLAFPLALVGLLWPVLHAFVWRSATMELWLALAAASLPLVAALPAGEAYLDMLPGNAIWSLAAFLAIGANWLASERLIATRAEHWSLWIFVAQLLTVAALLMTCYGTLAEWCMLLGLSLAVLATCRLFVRSGEWASTLSLPAIILSCCLLTHVRVYSGDGLPPWLVAVPMLLPVLVCGVDRVLAGKRNPRYRIAIAAAAAAIIAIAVIGYAVAPGQAKW